ncbi:50S ribosomal protein L17 [Candidatus Wolfebacteria bacterium]|nr:50S ribosomal protein L17 [Candidatus Wolfebacteria bacterium]
MRHRKEGRKFHRKRGGRQALFKHLLENFFSHGRIFTTEAKAKEIRPRVERLISIAKKESLSGRRTLLRYLPKKTATKVYHEIAPRYSARRGGYTRITKSSLARKGDGSRMAVLDLID